MQAHRQPSGPGKTAPRLIEDLIHYNPARNGEYNRLTDPAPRVTRGSSPNGRAADECTHVLVLKDRQTDAPPYNIQRPIDHTTRYVVASYCQKCRWHFHITVEFRGLRDGRQLPCSLKDEENLLHHLRHLGPSLPVVEGMGSDYDFVCSGSTCPLTVNIEISPPRLGPELLSKIDTRSVLDRRGTLVIQAEPERYDGLHPLWPIQVFLNLNQYLQDAQTTNAGQVRRIAKRNKKYCLAFANDCDDLFTYLGFKVVSEQKEEEGPLEYFWQLPTITNGNRNFIGDVKAELKQLIADIPEGERRFANTTSVVYAPLPALVRIENSLGYYGYRKKSRAIDLTEESVEHPAFASLGALEIFTDDFITWAYVRQRECDPQNSPYYLDCLHIIAGGRESADLHTTFSIASSSGLLRLTEIEAAYRYFVLDPDVPTTDDHIIGLFNSRIQSSAKTFANEAKENLRILGKARNSRKIDLVSMDQGSTYEDSLALLDVNATTPYDSVVASAISTSIDGTDEQKKMVPLALLLIGKEMGKENDLNGQTELLQAAFDMSFGNDLFRSDVDSAYRNLDLTNRNAPDQLVWQYYEHGGYFNLSAVRIIALDRKSKFLLARVDPGFVPGGARALASEPVGLDNIGNTCYLNSILQFYYTIGSIRDVVANIDDYRMNLDNPTIEKDINMKQVGGRKIARSEIQNAQKFVYGLKNLFEQLKTSPTSSVRPTTELANLTLLSDQKVAQYRRDSVTSPNGPPPLELIGQNIPVYSPDTVAPDAVVYGPQPLQLISPSPTPPPENDLEMVDRPTDKDSGFEDNGSDSTLIDADLLNGKSNAVDNPFDDEKNVVDEDDKIETLNLEDDIIMVNGENATTSENVPAEPEKPPPVPPRNKPDRDLWAFGAQQDVTEVVGNVVFRLQCAIKADSIEEGTGEQIDRIRDTFYGANATYTQKSQTLEKKVESWANLIIYPDPVGPRDIYAALDVTFDMQMVEVENMQTRQYSSITKLPPVLQMHIQRTAFDNIKKRPWKNMNSVTFPETLYMDRYMDSDDEVLLPRREESWKWKDRLRYLEERQALLSKQLSVDVALMEAKYFVGALQELDADGEGGLDIDPEILDALDERISEVRIELESLDTEATNIKQRLRDQFTYMTKHEYKLQTVFIHRGESGSGHYWIYIYDFENSVWREYNDDRISEIHDLKQIFEKHGVIDGTPYYLAYVRSADRKELVNAVVREVVEPSVEITMDVDDRESIKGRSNHIENVTPRELLPNLWNPNLPKTPVRFSRNDGTSAWDNSVYNDLDANGRPWDKL